jgi:hypothetical protein
MRIKTKKKAFVKDENHFPHSTNFVLTFNPQILSNFRLIKSLINLFVLMFSRYNVKSLAYRQLRLRLIDCLDDKRTVGINFLSFSTVKYQLANLPPTRPSRSR